MMDRKGTSSLLLATALLLSAALCSADDRHQRPNPNDVHPPFGMPWFGGYPVPNGAHPYWWLPPGFDANGGNAWFGYGFPGPWTGGANGAANGFSGYQFPGFGSGWVGGIPDWRDFAEPTTVCKEKGPCFNKKLSCPDKCFHSWGGSSKGAGGRGGGCNFDCTKCAAYC